MTTPASRPAHSRYPAPVADILAAQDAGYRSYTAGFPAADCPYDTSTPTNMFLRQQWATGRANARVDAMDAANMFNSAESEPRQ